MKKELITAYISVILAMTFWSLTYVWYKMAFETYRPITTVFLRLVLSSVILVMLMGPFRQLQKIDLQHDLKYFFLVTLFQPFLYFLCESFGVSLVSSTISAVIISTIPLFSPFATSYFFREKIMRFNIIGIVISIIGVGLVIFERGEDVEATPLGVLLLFLAVAAGIGYSIVVKKLSGKYNAVSIVTYHNIIGIFFYLPLFLIFDWKHFISVGFQPQAVLPLLELAIFGSSLAFIFFTFSINKIGVTKSNAFTNAIPVLTAIFAFFLLGETLTVIKMGGIALVIAGLFMSQIKRMPKLRKKTVIRPSE
ncbi:MAG: DMT family transporter [Bacteroidales bacterium]|nr:DMT family transporter [Bacteroidales bacterium]